MDSGLATVLAATVTGAFALFSVYVNKFRKENRTAGLLSMLYKSSGRIEGKVERLDDRLTDHIESHPYERVLDNDRPIHQDGVEGNSKVS
jgi:hypothetical protein